MSKYEMSLEKRQARKQEKKLAKKKREQLRFDLRSQDEMDLDAIKTALFEYMKMSA